MKQLLTILLILICFVGYGQRDSVKVNYNDFLKANISIDSLFWYRQDTIKVIMLVCDTSTKTGLNTYWIYKDDNDSNNDVGKSIGHIIDVYWQYGYEVSSISGIQHLDVNKKPLPKNIIVWQSIQVK